MKSFAVETFLPHQPYVDLPGCEKVQLEGWRLDSPWGSCLLVGELVRF